MATTRRIIRADSKPKFALDRGFAGNGVLLFYGAYIGKHRTQKCQAGTLEPGRKLLVVDLNKRFSNCLNRV